MEDYRSSNDHVLERLSILESHLINLIHPLQNLHKLSEMLNSIAQAVAKWERQVNNADLRFEKVKAESGKILETLHDELKNIDFSQTAGEIKYIGKRLWQIESCLTRMEAQGIKKDVQISVSVDGHKQENKEKNPGADPALSDLMNFFKETPAVLKYIKSCLSIRTTKPHFYVESLGISRERFYQVRKKAARMLRSKELDNILRGLKDKKFALWLSLIANKY